MNESTSLKGKIMHYINRDGQRYRETVDEFNSRKEAVEAVKEYRLADPSAAYWISSRACKEWRETT